MAKATADFEVVLYPFAIPKIVKGIVISNDANISAIIFYGEIMGFDKIKATPITRDIAFMINLHPAISI